MISKFCLYIPINQTDFSVWFTFVKKLMVCEILTLSNCLLNMKERDDKSCLMQLMR